MAACAFCGGEASQPCLFCQPAERARVFGPPVVRPARFDGADYVPPRDDQRLSSQYWRIWGLMRDGGWRSLAQIAQATGDPPASISAQLRHMRKPRFGGHTVNRRYLGDGYYEYQVEAR